MRIGQGIDIHAFGPPATDGATSTIMLGGVAVPFGRPLVGHSDGDVVLHSIIDALLGASALGDIGGMFPSSDEQWRGASSIGLLRSAYERVRAAGYAAANVDVTVVAEEPRLAPFSLAMRECIARALELDITLVSVKATTTDGLGFTGRGEGIAAFAAVLLQ